MSYGDPTTCECGATIRFQQNEQGRWIPFNVATGRNHFIDCPKADAFRKPASKPEPEPTPAPDFEQRRLL